jgi:glutathione synthase/RimK-type ligase-like ATP-grasp enzyme
MVDLAREMEDNRRTTLVVLKEKGEFLLGLLRRWESMGVPVYNPLDASERTRKTYQLARLAAAGLPVPESLWTNDPEAVLAFARGRRVAYKPVSGGAATRELVATDLARDRLARLTHSPVTFQELLPGEDLRIFVLDGRVVAAFRIEVEEGALDYRQNEQRIESVSLEPAVEEMARRAAAEIGLRFTGMDLKRAADGSWRLLELNPSPMFLGFDQRAGTDVLGALAGALMGE